MDLNALGMSWLMSVQFWPAKEKADILFIESVLDRYAERAKFVFRVEPNPGDTRPVRDEMGSAIRGWYIRRRRNTLNRRKSSGV